MPVGRHVCASLAALAFIFGPRGGMEVEAAEPLDEPLLLEFHFKPVANLQIAIWLEDANGNFVEDVFVTQATGKLGIGNRAGYWDFVSSWRAPYGPRPMVLPVWAHARGKSYPKIVFHDDDAADQESLGWHENSSSPESYFCRPLTQDEHDVISTDTMTCPSPATFQSDKGRFHETDTSVYPPRNDLIEFEPLHDSADAMEFSVINDLDSITGATPPGGKPLLKTVSLDELPAGNLVANIEVSLELDENASYDFEREDHFIDTRLPGYGIGFFGQPSVVFQVEFDPRDKAFSGTSNYAGHGEWDGSSGELYPPNAGISEADGSGADRLKEYTLNGETFRFGVFSHGVPGGGGTTGGTTTTTSGGTDSGGTTGDSDSDTGWGNCNQRELPPVMSLELEPMDFDRVLARFQVPEMAEDVSLMNARVFYRPGKMPIDPTNLSQAVEAICDTELMPGSPASCEINELFGNTTYQVAVQYEDGCNNQSGVTADEVKTPAQKFAQVDTFCVVATAAYGGNWALEVDALRAFRDRFLKPNGVGLAFTRFYYAHGPLLARAISSRPWARGLTRTVLQPLADLAALSTGMSARR